MLLSADRTATHKRDERIAIEQILPWNTPIEWQGPVGDKCDCCGFWMFWVGLINIFCRGARAEVALVLVSWSFLFRFFGSSPFRMSFRDMYNQLGNTETRDSYLIKSILFVHDVASAPQEC